MASTADNAPDPPEEAPDPLPLIHRKVIEHPDEFISELTGITAPWARAFGTVRPWFRGMARLSFALEPSLLRYRPRRLVDTENNLVNLFHAYAARMVEHVPTTRLEWLSVMQHHGAPTRLLDWTENAFAALYFAVREFQHLDDSEDAVVWILEPLQLTNLIAKERRILFSDDKLLQLPHPIPLYPVHKSDRVGVQRGTFTLHPFNPQHVLVKMALQERAAGRPPFLGALRIRGAKRRFIRQALVDGFGAGDFTFFPDLDGLCRELRMRESLEGKG